MTDNPKPRPRLTRKHIDSFRRLFTLCQKQDALSRIMVCHPDADDDHIEIGIGYLRQTFNQLLELQKQIRWLIQSQVEGRNYYINVLYDLDRRISEYNHGPKISE